MYRSPHNKESWIYQRFGVKGSGWAVGWHTGCDSVAGENTDVVSVADGKVIVAGTGTYGASYGRMVFIKNNDGGGVLYAHLNSIAVSAGQTVKAGQKIGTEGRSGSIGAREHLHLEIHTDGVYHYAQHVDDAQKYIDYGKYVEINKPKSSVRDCTNELKWRGIIIDQELWDAKGAADVDLQGLFDKYYWYILKNGGSVKEPFSVETSDQALAILQKQGIVSDYALWNGKAYEDRDVYWLLLKMADYIN